MTRSDAVGVFGILRYLGRAWQASDPEAAHHQLDGAARDGHLSAQRELGVNSAGAVGLPGLVVDLADHVGDHRVAHRTR